MRHCRHCPELITRHPSGAWTDVHGSPYCLPRYRLPHEPMPLIRAA